MLTPRERDALLEAYRLLAALRSSHLTGPLEQHLVAAVRAIERAYSIATPS